MTGDISPGSVPPPLSLSLFPKDRGHPVTLNLRITVVHYPYLLSGSKRISYGITREEWSNCRLTHGVFQCRAGMVSLVIATGRVVSGRAASGRVVSDRTF